MNRRDLMKLSALGLVLPGQTQAASSKPSHRVKLKKNLILVSLDLGLFEKNYHDSGASCKYMYDFFSDFKGEMTYFDNMEEPSLLGLGGHGAQPATFTGMTYGDRFKFPDRTLISLDQHIADNTIQETRNQSIYHCVGGGYNLSWNKFSQPLPSIKGANKLYDVLFGKTDEASARALIRRERDILVALEKNLRRRWKGTKVEQELKASVLYKLELLNEDEKWLKVKKPHVKKAFAENIDSSPLTHCKHNYQLIFDGIAQQQTKIAMYQFGGNGITRGLAGITKSHHANSHHGYFPDRVGELERIDSAVLGGLRGLLENLKTAGLYDDTIVLFSCGISDANRHRSQRIPAFLFGGGFNHQESIDCLAKDGQRRYSTTSLFSSILKQSGMKNVKFNGNEEVMKELFKA